MKNQKIKNLVYGATIAALYVVLTYLSAILGLASGAVQLRLSEALVILPIFLPSAVPGLFVGCIIANLLSGGVLLDVIFGSIATLIGALGTRFLRKNPSLAFLPPVIANTLIVPPVIYFVYGSDIAMPLVYLGVFVGEAISCGVFGYILYKTLKNKSLFK